MRPVAEVGALPDALPGTEPVVLQGLLREASHEAHEAVRLVLELPAEAIVVAAHVRRLRLALVHVVAEVARAAAARGGDAEMTIGATFSGTEAVVEIRDTTAGGTAGPASDGLDLVVARVLVERDGGAVWAAEGGGLHLRLPLYVGPVATL